MQQTALSLGMDCALFPETTESLIAAAASAGHAVTGRKIADWHRDGLLPRPTVEHRGKPLGNLSRYPAEARARLLALLPYRVNEKLPPVPEMLWRLFAAGFAIEERRLRPHFVRLAGQLDAFARAATRLTHGAAEGVEGDAEQLESIAAKFTRDRAWKARLGPFFPRHHTTQVIEMLGGEREASRELLDAMAPAFGETQSTAAEGSDLVELLDCLRVGSIQGLAEGIDYAELQQVTSDLARQAERISALFGRPVMQVAFGLHDEASAVVQHLFSELSHPLFVLLILVERRHASVPMLGPTLRELAKLAGGALT